MRPLLVISILVAMVGYTVGEYYSKQWALSHEWDDAMRAVVAYTGSCFAWISIMYHYRDIFVASVVWELGCVLVAAFIGVYLFKEKLSFSQWAGSGLAVVAMFLLLRK